MPLFSHIVRAAVLSHDRIDLLITEALPVDWPIGRIDPVLRAAACRGAELSVPDGPPTWVVINEYLDVAHGFFTGEPWETSRGLLHCRGCQGQTSLSAGTIFQDHWSKGDTLLAP